RSVTSALLHDVRPPPSTVLQEMVSKSRGASCQLDQSAGSCGRSWQLRPRESVLTRSHRCPDHGARGGASPVVDVDVVASEGGPESGYSQPRNRAVRAGITTQVISTTLANARIALPSRGGSGL